MFQELRREPRQPVSLPVKLSGETIALARNVSSSGMYIEVDGRNVLRGTVRVEMEIVEAGMKLSADGEIVRIEHFSEGKTGIGVRLHAPRLEPIG